MAALHAFLVRPLLLLYLLVLTAWLLAQNTYTEEFTNPAAPALTAVHSGQFDARYCVTATMWSLILIALCIDCLVDIFPERTGLRIAFTVAGVLATLATFVLLVLLLVGLGYANTGRTTCSDPRICCVESVRADLSNGCPNSFTGPCTGTFTLAAMRIAGWCIWETVLVIPLCVGLPLYMQSSYTATKKKAK